eukprot:1158196-Pelagomonas_calceolata.AAC.1
MLTHTLDAAAAAALRWALGACACTEHAAREAGVLFCLHVPISAIKRVRQSARLHTVRTVLRRCQSRFLSVVHIFTLEGTGGVCPRGKKGGSIDCACLRESNWACRFASMVQLRRGDSLAKGCLQCRI